MEPRTLDEYYRFGDVYETMDACDKLETHLARLKRQHLLDEEFHRCKQDVANIRRRIEAHITSQALTPKGPRLP